MATTHTVTPQRALLTPEGMFVIHLRSDSAAARQHLVGRVEHVKSGDSEAFASLGALLGFIDRHAPGTAQPVPDARATSDREG
jgi:hypothetical protein